MCIDKSCILDEMDDEKSVVIQSSAIPLLLIATFSIAIMIATILSHPMPILNLITMPIFMFGAYAQWRHKVILTQNILIHKRVFGQDQVVNLAQLADVHFSYSKLLQYSNRATSSWIVRDADGAEALIKFSYLFGLPDEYTFMKYIDSYLHDWYLRLKQERNVSIEDESRILTMFSYCSHHIKLAEGSAEAAIQDPWTIKKLLKTIGKAFLYYIVPAIIVGIIAIPIIYYFSRRG